MSSIPLPALGVKAPEQPDLLSKVAQLQQLRNLGQQGQIQQQTLKENALQLQQKQQQMKDQQTIMQVASQYQGGLSNPQALQDLSSKVSAATFIPLQKSLAETAKSYADLDEKQLANEKSRSDQLLGLVSQGKQLPPDQYQQAWPSIVQKAVEIEPKLQGHVDPNQPIPQQALDSLALGFATHSQLASVEAEKRAQAEEQRKAALAPWQLASAQAEAQLKQKQAEMGGTSPEAAELTDFLRKNPGKGPSDFLAAKAAAEAKATLPYKLQVAAAEAQAKQVIEGNVKPVYGVDKQTGDKSLMSQTDALKQGRVVIPVTEKQVGDDIMLTNRLGYVRQKIARYEQSLAQDISDKDKGNMAALLAHNGFKVGAFGTEIPMDRLNAALQKENLEGLSPAARTQLVAYKNVMEAMVGYQRVLSGSGRSSDKAMQLNIGTLPDPSVSDRAFSAESLKQFKENLGVVGQGLPRIPGIKSPEEIERQVTIGTRKTYQGHDYEQQQDGTWKLIK